MKDGRNCDNCENWLSNSDYDEYGSWSYTCPDCGFRYRHSSERTTEEQVSEFNAKDGE